VLHVELLAAIVTQRAKDLAERGPKNNTLIFIGTLVFISLHNIMNVWYSELE